MNRLHSRSLPCNLGRALLALAFATIFCLTLVGAAQADQALLILKSGSYADTDKTCAQLERIGCHAQHVIPPRCIIAEVPVKAERKVLALANVSEMFRGPVPEYAMATGLQAEAMPDIASGMSAWNAIIAPATTSVPAEAAMPLGDAVFSDEVDNRFTAMAATSRKPGYYDTSDFMIGKIAVGVILPESDGSGEWWTTTRQNEVFNGIVTGMNGWISAGGNAAHITFVYEQKYNYRCANEPIQTTDETIWISQVMANIGFGSGTAQARVRDYNNDLRTRTGSDWAFSIFVADSYNDTDGCFPDGSFAFTILFGPYTVLTYDNSSWGIGNMYRVAAHEVGHDFAAGDEYVSSGWSCQTDYDYGYLWIADGNCENGNPNSVDCIMKRNTFNGTTCQTCTWTRQQLGWRDSDSDGTFDPIDCTVNNTLNSVSSIISTSATFTGTTNITPTTCVHPYESWGGPNSCTINRISSVEYAVDGAWGHWATATDGSFNSDSEDYTFTATGLSNGQHTFQTKVTDNYGNISYSTVQTIQINAYYQPCIVKNQDGRLQAFERGRVNNSLYTSWQTAVNATTWTSWTTIGSGNYAGNPSAVLDNTGIITVAIRALDGSISNLWQTAPNAYGTWSTGGFGGNVAGDAKITMNQNGMRQAFVRGGNNVLYTTWENPRGTWVAWTPIGVGSYAGDPSVILDNTGILTVAMRHTDGSIRNLWQTAANAYNSWSTGTWGGNVPGNPVLALNQNGMRQVFVRGGSGYMHTYYENPRGTWIGWNSIAGGTSYAGNPAVILDQSGELNVFCRMTSGVLGVYWQTTPNSYLTWSSGGLDNNITYDPAVGKCANGLRQTIVLDTAGAMNLRCETSPGAWGAWSVMPGSP